MPQPKILVEFREIQKSLGERQFRPFGPLKLLEAAAGSVTYRLSGVIQNCLDVNANLRVYPKHIWEAQFANGSPFQKKLNERAVLGMIEHPEDGITRLDEVSHVMVEARFASVLEIAESKGALREGDIVGTLEILNTPRGLVLKALVEANIPFGVSSRGSGTVTEAAGHFQVNDDFMLETWDAVFSPSVERAIPRLVQEVSQSPATVSESIAKIQQTPTIQIQEAVVFQRVQVGEKMHDIVLKDGKYSVPSLPELAESDTVGGTMAALRKWAGIAEGVEEDHQKPPVESVVSNESKPKHTMSKLHEAKLLKSQIIGLAQTSLKGLKPSDKSALFESVDNMRVQMGIIVKEDSTVSPLAEDAYSRLNAFAKRLDEDDMDEVPTPGAPASPVPPAAPEEGADCGADCEVLMHAAELLRDAAEGGNSAEDALEVAEQLEGIADTMTSGEVETEDAEPFEDVQIPDDLPMEGKRVIRKLVNRLRINENRTERLCKATNHLLSEHKRLKSNRRPGGESGKGSINEANAKLVSKYNSDMCDLGRLYFKQTQPNLYKVNERKLTSCRTWVALSSLTETIMREKKAAGGRTPAPIAESITAPKPPAITTTVPKATPLSEAKPHGAVSMLRTLRKGVI